MRFLIYSLNYAPELTGIGKYTGEMAEWLCSHGHSVRVVTAPPYYPEWRVGSGYSAWRYCREVINGVTVWRCPLWVPSRPSGLKRLLHLFSYALTSFPVMLQQCVWRPDLVLVVEPPMFCAPTAWLTARLSGGKACLHIQDFELDAAFELGLLPQGPIRTLAARLESAMMKGFDRVSTISNSMLDRLIAKGVSPSRVSLFPNWVDPGCIYPDKQLSRRLREELGLSEQAKVVLYSGNLGEKQGLEIVVEVARSLERYSDILFLICGEGAAKRRLQEQAKGLSNVRFIPLQPTVQLNALLNLADIHLLPQRADVADLVMPSKLAGILASGGAVIATAREGTELARVLLEIGGVLSEPGQVVNLSEQILRLASDDVLRQGMGARARAYAEAHIAMDAILTRFVDG